MYFTNEESLDYLKNWFINEQGYKEEDVENKTYFDEDSGYLCSDLTHSYYKVLGEEEILDEIRDDVLDKVWTFSPEFIAEHAENWNYGLRDAIEDALERCQWNLNPIILALIGNDNIEEFIHDAIEEYGVDEFMDMFYSVYDADDYIIFESDYEY